MKRLEKKKIYQIPIEELPIDTKKDAKGILIAISIRNSSRIRNIF